MKFISLARLKNETLKSNTSPRVTALSLAIGIFLAFSPFPGIHIILAFVLNKLFKLNPVVMLIGVFFHNPWTMLPIHFSGYLIGDLLINGNFNGLAMFGEFPWHELGLASIFDTSFWNTNGQALKLLFIPFFLGSLLQASVLFGISYRLSLAWLIRMGRGVELK